MPKVSVILDIFDPRGRVSRKGLVLIAAVLIGLQIGVYGTFYLTDSSLPFSLNMALSGLFAWIAFSAVTKRMHDIGVSAAWMGWGALACVVCAVLVAFAVVFTFGEDAVAPGAWGYMLVAASVLLPAIAATVWLHFAPGEQGTNRFGPAPDLSDISYRHRRLLPSAG